VSPDDSDVPAKPTLCRLCGSAAIRDLGAIPDSDYFAGQVLSGPLSGGSLWGCQDCASMFRYPILTGEQYLSLYRSGDPKQWSADEHRAEHWDSGRFREDLRIIRSIIADARVRSALDVGCGSGEFLASLPVNVAKFGIEPSWAGEFASRRGIDIVARQLDEFAAQERFDAVTIIDVIEHVPEVEPFLTRAYARLSPGGLLIVSTGNPDNRLWREWLRGRFWYVIFPEHITFPSLSFFKSWCTRTGAVLAERHITRYQRAGLARRLLGAAIQALFVVNPHAFNWLGRSLRTGVRAGKAQRRTFSPGIPGTFRDHQIVVMRKPAAQ
jgi:SAM-dependent methyltransferase